jgi:hypothetical protein
MRFGQETPGGGRPPTAAEKALWAKVKAKMKDASKALQRLNEAGGCLNQVKGWTTANVPGYVFPMDMNVFAGTVQYLNQQYSNAQLCVFKVESGLWGVFKRPDREDFDIMIGQGGEGPMQPYENPGFKGFGQIGPIPIPVVMVLGRIILAAIIALIAWIIGESYNAETKAKVMAQQVNADMAKQDAGTRAAYEKFTKDDPILNSSSWWQNIKQAAMGLGVMALIGFAIFAFAGGLGKKREAAN